MDTSSVNPPVAQQPVMLPQAPKSSSNMGMILVIVFVVLVVAGIGGYAFMNKQSYQSKLYSTPTVAPVQTVVSPSMMPASGLTSGNSDADLEQDSKTLDTSVKASDSQINAVDQGLHDQTVNLAE